MNRIEIINAWTSSVEDEESDSIVRIEANVLGYKRPTIILGIYDSDKITVDTEQFKGLSVRQANNIINKKYKKYFKLVELLENPGGLYDY